MTYSIVARDPDTGELGVAVQTSWPMVGASVPWVEAGVGAVVTQASTNVDLGPAVLELLREGRTADMALRAALETDSEAALRQLTVVDARGRVSAHTGESCVIEASHVTAADVSCQGNMLAAQGTPEAMLEAFTAARGDLAERMMTALVAAEDAGGDVRGAQSAALAVAPGHVGARPWSRRFDLRVDDSTAPLDELARLLRVARAFESLGSARKTAEHGAYGDAAREAGMASELAPGDAQIAFWHAVMLLADDRPAEARNVLAAASDEAPQWVAYAQRVSELEPDLRLANAISEATRLLRGES